MKVVLFLLLAAFQATAAMVTTVPRAVSAFSARGSPIMATSSNTVRMAVIDPNTDWFSNTAMTAEGMLTVPEDACDAEELAEVDNALAVAIQSHRRLRNKIRTRITKLRNQQSNWFLDLDH